MSKLKTNTNEPEEDVVLKQDLKRLVENIVENDPEVLGPSLEKLKHVMRTTYTPVVSLPKPLKFLRPYYGQLKQAYEKIADERLKKICADILSVMAMFCHSQLHPTPPDCLFYCLRGTIKDATGWGTEYVTYLAGEIIDDDCVIVDDVKTLVKMIIHFDFEHHAHINACDLAMEVDKTKYLESYIHQYNYMKICQYLEQCAMYTADVECEMLRKFVMDQYFKFGNYGRVLKFAMILNDGRTISELFKTCPDRSTRFQLSYMIARQNFFRHIPFEASSDDLVKYICGNCCITWYLNHLAMKLNLLEPVSPDEVFKKWLEPAPKRSRIINVPLVESWRQMFGTAFANAWINVGFGTDKLITVDEGSQFIYKHNHHTMTSITGTLGLVYLWDVNSGLLPIENYLYSNEIWVRAGAFLALGLTNCRVNNKYDPALVILSDFTTHNIEVTRICAIFGLGLAYVGTCRFDVLETILPSIQMACTGNTLAVTYLACGMITVGTGEIGIYGPLIKKLSESNAGSTMRPIYITLAILAIGLCCIELKDDAERCLEELESMDESLREMAKTIVNMCAYAGSGDTKAIQYVLCQCYRDESTIDEQSSPVSQPDTETQRTQSDDNEFLSAMSIIALGVISLGNNISMEMCLRILGHAGRYGVPYVRVAVPLAIGIMYASNPAFAAIDLLSKYCHDQNDKIANSAIFALGIIGAGTKSSKIINMLRELAIYHSRNKRLMFTVRLSQGLLHLGKGTMTLSPLHSRRSVLDRCALAGLLITTVAFLDMPTTIWGQDHYLLFALAPAIQPRWLITLNERLLPTSVPIRVGTVVDTVTKAGKQKTITGMRTLTTPVLLEAEEGVELATNRYYAVAPVLEGICILKKKSVPNPYSKV